MKRSYRGKRLGVLLVLLLSGCSSVETDVAVERTQCCALQPVDSFSIDATGMPSFLRSYFVEELAAVLRAKGLTASDPGDVQISLSYQAGDLAGARPVNVPDETGEQVRTPGRVPRDTFDGSMGSEAPSLFMARVTMEMRREDTVVWSGVLSRPHRVTTGEYMHERARAAIHIAFERLLEEFPVASESSSQTPPPAS